MGRTCVGQYRNFPSRPFRGAGFISVRPSGPEATLCPVAETGNFSPEVAGSQSTPAALHDNDPTAEAHVTEGEDAVSPKFLKQHVKPSADEVAAHNVSHVPGIAWRRYCVRGCGRSQGHPRLQSHSNDQLPTLELDYGFQGGKESAATDMPTLCDRERQTAVVWSSPVPAKGVEDSPHGSNRLKDWIEET